MLMTRFFKSVREWPCFDNNKEDDNNNNNGGGGQVVLGLKSTETATNYQLEYWNVAEIALANGFQLVHIGQPMVPFWRATHVNGRPLDTLKHIFDDKQVFVTFYSFQIIIPQTEEVKSSPLGSSNS